MVDDVSLRTGNIAGMQRTGELDGLNTGEAMAKVSTAEGKLEARQKLREGHISGQKTTIKWLEGHRNNYKRMAKNPFLRNYAENKIKRLDWQINHHKGIIKNLEKEIGGIKQDLGVLKNVMNQLKGDLAEKAAMLKSALESGDFEAALGMVLNDRLDTLDTQLKAKVEGMNKRNEEILALNNKLAGLKGDKSKGAQKTATKLQGQIDKLNSDSQLDMIKLQSLTNKRNQAFELMSNLTQKFSQSVDKVIGNIR